MNRVDGIGQRGAGASQAEGQPRTLAGAAFQQFDRMTGRHLPVGVTGDQFGCEVQ